MATRLNPEAADGETLEVAIRFTDLDERYLLSDSRPWQETG